MTDGFTDSVRTASPRITGIDAVKDSRRRLSTGMCCATFAVVLADVESYGLASIVQVIGVAVKARGAETLGLMIAGATNGVFAAFDIQTGIGALASVGRIGSANIVGRAVFI